MNKALAEQAGGDERAAFERAFTVQEGIYFDDKRGEYRSMNLCAIEASDAQDLNLQLQGWQARAALAQPSPMYDPKRCLACGGDHGNSGLPCPNMRVTAQAQPSPKCVKCGGTGEADSGGVHPWGEPVLIPCDCETEQAVAERPEVVAYADPVAFATFKEQQLHDLDKQCRDDVARALGLRPNKERGFAWSYLLASIKSCVKASGDSAQAQHSVPEGWKLVPVEPTEDVLEAIHNGGYVGDDQELRWFYQSILAAAPAPGGE
ncbi:hypothetical protein [Pseudomonas aeruginosa]|uniref:hypothetical protein n=1 Tax=Pseudomonas aeruginosa TaxID=287 RepID=UPI001A9F06AC|nr:hypothetical protein [Pseudomonas aeruginosa]